MEYEIKGWEGYFLSINDNDIKVYTSWGFCKGTPKESPRQTEIIHKKRKKINFT